MSTLKEWRLKRFLTQDEVAQKAGLCRDTVNQVERGRQTPELKTIRKLAKALGTAPGNILFSEREIS